MEQTKMIGFLYYGGELSSYGFSMERFLFTKDLGNYEKVNYKKFLTGEEKDFKGRSLEEIWNFSDQEIESIHDFIQIIFPLNKPSQSVFHGHYLDSDEILQKVKQNTQAKENIIKSSKWFLSFLKRNSCWNRKHDHNHLRITRIIRSLRLLVSDNEASRFYVNVIELIKNNNHVNKETLEFWKNA